MDDEDADAAPGPGSKGKRPELPMLEFGRLGQTHEEIPLHQQHKHHVQHLPMSYGGGASPSPQPSKRVGRLRLARFAHLDGDTKAKVSRSVQTAHVKEWLHAHGYVVKADKLHPAVSRVIEEWFQLVDDDNSRTLEHDELLSALKAAQIPCDDATISEMINLMDVNKDGVIDWEEFEVFMTEEIAAGKSLLSGEYLLPSGTSLNFGVMIGKLKRNKLLRDIMEDPSRRNRWAAIANNPDALGRELATMQQAVEATTLTLEHMKRSEGSAMRGATPRTQLASALVRGMDEGRARGTAAGEPARSLAVKLRAGLLGQGCELLQHDPISPEHPRNPARHSQGGTHHSCNPIRTPRRACPDPVTVPLTPTGSEGNFSTCSSRDPFMQMHVSAQREPRGTSGGAPAAAGAITRNVATAAPPCGAGSNAHGGGREGGMAHGSAISYGVSGVVPCTSASVTSLGWWAGHGPGPSASGAPQAVTAAAAAAAAGSTQDSPSKSPSQALSPARRSNAPFSPRTGGSQAPSSPVSSPGLIIARAGSRCGSAASRQAVDHRSGGGTSAAAAHRGRSPSSATGSSPGPGAILPRPGSGLQTALALEPHYLAASTASCRARARPPSRVMSQVSLMAQELRAAPGRYSAEPPGLPAAVLAATRGQWGPVGPGCSGSGSGDTQAGDGLPHASMDDFVSSVGQASKPGCGEGVVVPTPVSTGWGVTAATSGFLSSDERPASPPPPPLLRSHRSSCSTLPVLTSHRPELLDCTVIDEERGSVGKADVAVLGTTSRATLDSGTSSRSYKAGATAAAAPSLPEVPSHVLMRLPGTVALENPASPGGALSAAVHLLGHTASPLPEPATNPVNISMAPCASGDPREVSSRPSCSAAGLSPYALWQCQGPIATVAAVGTITTAVAPQLTGMPTSMQGAVLSDTVTASTTTTTVTSGSKALKPTSIMLRISPGAAAHTGGVTARYGDTSRGDGAPVASPTLLLRQRRVSRGGKQRGSEGSGSGSTRGSTADGALPYATHGSAATAALDGPVSGVEKGAKYGPNTLGIPTDEAAASFWLHHSHDGECLYAGDDSCDVDGEGVGHVWSPGRKAPRKASVPSGDGGGGRKRTWMRSRPQASGSGDGAGARHRREAAATAAVATLLLDSMRSSAAASGGAASSAPGSALRASKSRSSPLPSAPASPDGRAPGGAASQGTDAGATSSNCRGDANGSPVRPTQSLIGPPEGRPPSRTRTPLGARGDREDSLDYSWRAATASLLQLHMTHQLNDPADGRRA
ncbi:hypothetical protein VOLCADRAFT_119867 [Volvox carteri f. nagariensis]|uniref:EF-hand domain-containing protein n=1 Tax=Volvox carteri f. nagariensis TaxID=3068 RepID=D8UHK6_VOLCA|nr:uncharacterized protein VOLCADRAFT_119867 [Volvox carteri f. nagariensis]EFJ40760.1 hypothetical protein VOLCADRAFT_119867 [Volvox carteri f. nagariensis]|eukprot:XP_002958135.1 hypothetical protein VOLCADRAFT_119867 [Volvox carteri f. nagariensis]